MIEKEQIIEQLNNLKAPKNKPVIVHSSLKAVGEINGGAKTLLDIFIEYFTSEGGVLIVPTHTWHNTFKDIVLDMASPDTCIGTFSKIALQDKRGRRTTNPTHSMVIFGEDNKIQEFLDAEEGVLKPTDSGGAYAKLYNGGCVLLIGVGQEKNTYLHAVEEMIGVPNRFSDAPIEMKVKKLDGSIQTKPFYYIDERDIGDVSTRFPKYEPAFRHYGGIVDGFIGNAKTQLCDAKIMADVMKLIRKNSGGVEILRDNSPIEEIFFKN